MSRKLQLEKKAQIISKFDEEILEEIEDEREISSEIETVEELHSEIAVLRIKIECVTTKIRERKTRRTTRASEINNPETINMKLPKLDIKRFSGDQQSINRLR